MQIVVAVLAAVAANPRPLVSAQPMKWMDSPRLSLRAKHSLLTSCWPTLQPKIPRLSPELYVHIFTALHMSLTWSYLSQTCACVHTYKYNRNFSEASQFNTTNSVKIFGSKKKIHINASFYLNLNFTSKCDRRLPAISRRREHTLFKNKSL